MEDSWLLIKTVECTNMLKFTLSIFKIIFNDQTFDSITNQRSSEGRRYWRVSKIFNIDRASLFETSSQDQCERKNIENVWRGVTSAQKALLENIGIVEAAFPFPDWVSKQTTNVEG